MTVKRPPYNLKSSYHIYTAQVLQDLADLAKKGHLEGVAIAALTDKNEPILKVAGRLHYRPRDAYWIVGLLKDTLLHIDSL